MGGLLNATFGNITELIIGVLLVAAGEFAVVKASLIGSILGNLVLVLGACYFFGGLRHREQRFDIRSARIHSTSLLLNAAGWRGIHAIDAIAYGDGPRTFADCVTQEFQWARRPICLRGVK